MIFIGHSLGGLLIKEVCRIGRLSLAGFKLINGLTQALALAISNHENIGSLDFSSPPTAYFLWSAEPWTEA